MNEVLDFDADVAPLRERELKHTFEFAPYLRDVAPLRERELKHDIGGHNGTPQLSLPYGSVN